MELFGPDTEKMLHGYIGKTATTVFVYVAIVAFAIFALSIIVGFGRSAFTTLSPLVPKTGWDKWADWAFRILLIVGFTVSVVYTIFRIRKIETTYEGFQEKVGTFSQGMGGAGQHLDERIQEQDGRISNHEERLKHLEGKVGDRLTDAMINNDREPDVRFRRPGL